MDKGLEIEETKKVEAQLEKLRMPVRVTDTIKKSIITDKFVNIMIKSFTFLGKTININLFYLKT